MRLLCTADLHLGRRPSRLPPAALGDAAVSTAGVWLAIVEAAMAGEADAVLLTGDIVDRRNRYFEALGPLESGLRRLAEAGIPVYAVAGNHDFDVLPRLADELPPGALTVLGRGGEWQRARVERRGETIYLDGWSFPAERVAGSPLAEYTLPPPAEAPALGLLHCDLGARDSVYAPVTAAELRARPPVAWLLGHVHVPGPAGGSGKLLLYPGSPLPLDPTETGLHGPWWVEVHAGGAVECAQVPLAPLRYERIEVDLSTGEDRQALDAEARVSAALYAALRRARLESSELRWLLARLELAGEVPAAALRKPLESSALDAAPEHEGARLRVIEERNRLRPAIELGALARLDDPAGELARELLALERGEGSPELLREARGQLERVHNAAGFQAVAGDAPPRDEALRRHLLAAGRRLLAALLAQRPEAAS